MINLLPHELKEERAYGRRNLSLIGYSGALLATALLTAGIIYGSLRFIGSEEPDLREQIETSQTDITRLEGQIKDIESISLRLETAKKISDKSVEFSSLIPEIGAILPDGVVLNALSLSGGLTDSLQLDVDLISADLAPVLVKNLVESGVFEAADIASLTPKGTTEEEGASEYSFSASISASFTGTAEAKRKEAAAAAAAAAAAQEAAAKNEEGSE